MTPRQPAKATSARTRAAEPPLRKGRSRTGSVHPWHGRLLRAAWVVLLITGLPALVAGAYSAYVRGQLWLTGVAVLSLPGLVVVAALTYFSPHADHPVVESRRLPKGTGAQRQELSEVIAERTRGLAAVAEVAHATTSVLDPSVLLPRVVELVCDRFGLYYVGLFLVNEERSYAVLRAGSGAAGQQMLAQGHRLEVGGESMIGQCVATGKPDVQLDVGEAAVRFDNPLLPATRSELALPLRVRERVIGALTVQSERADAFDDTSVSLLQTMADQVAVAIDNARLFAESQAALDEMEAVQKRYTVRAWREYLAEGHVGRSATVGAGVDEEAIAAEIRQALGHGTTTVISVPPPTEDSADRQGHSALVLPIALRGQTVGVLGVHGPDAQRGWSEPDITLAEAVAERLAFAAENLRLLDVTQRRAAREQLTAQIGQRVRDAADLREIMHVAAEALGQELNASEVVFRLGTAEGLLGVKGVE